MHAPLQLIKSDFQALADALEDPESDPNCKVGGVKTEGVLEGNNWALRFLSEIFEWYPCTIYIYIYMYHDVMLLHP